MILLGTPNITINLDAVDYWLIILGTLVLILSYSLNEIKKELKVLRSRIEEIEQSAFSEDPLSDVGPTDQKES